MPQKEIHKPTDLPAKTVVDIVHADSDRRPVATAKPIIVTNRPLVQDPMVTPLTIDGLSSPVDKDQHSKTETAAIKTKLEPLEPALVSDVTPAPKAPADEELSVAETESLVVQKKHEKDDEGSKQDEELQEAIDARTFFLPIDAASHRRCRHVTIIGMILILVLAIAWIDVSLDAGLITIPGLQPITHFFGNVS